MVETFAIRKDQSPGLIGLLHADLQRYRCLLAGKPAGCVRLWLGLLAPRFAPVLLIRLMGSCERLRLRPLARVFSLVNCVLFGIEVATRCRIGAGLFLPHTHGTVIGAFRIGKNAVIYQGVTIGARDLDFTYDAEHRPFIGDDVIIGAGAVVLGGITIANQTVVGANAVVTRSTFIGAVVVGVPAMPIKSSAEMAPSNE